MGKLIKGARRIFDWLKTKKQGAIVKRREVLDAAGWKDSALATYLKKNKLAPFLLELSDGRFKIVMNGRDISEAYFHETFTQTAPRVVSLTPGDRLDGDAHGYELAEPIANGAVGNVWSAKVVGPPKVTMVAVKVMLPRADLLAASRIANVRERFRREAANGRKLSHPNLVRYLDAGDVQGNPFLVMELAESSIGREVRDDGPMPEEDASDVIACAVDALGYLHGKGSPHRDVKPDNLLRFEDTYKLGDLGIVRWDDLDPLSTSAGTITRASIQLGSWFYMAPEQQQNPHEATDESDIYALGVSWIELLTGACPPPQAIGAQAFDAPSDDPEVSDLIRRMVAYDPAKRPVLSEIRTLLNAN